MNKNCTVFERTTPNERNVFCERKKWMEFVIVEQNGYFHGYDEKNRLTRMCKAHI